MCAEVFALMPKEISDLYESWMAEKEKDDLKRWGFSPPAPHHLAGDGQLKE
jgi:hypothetical protein